MSPEEFKDLFLRLEAELKEVIVGHAEVIRQVLIGFFAGGHVLLEGAPGLGKTLLVKSLSRALGFSFKRVQFTPDLMPADIVGTQVLSESGGRRAVYLKPRAPLSPPVLLGDTKPPPPQTPAPGLRAVDGAYVDAL